MVIVPPPFVVNYDNAYEVMLGHAVIVVKPTLHQCASVISATRLATSASLRSILEADQSVPRSFPRRATCARHVRDLGGPATDQTRQNEHEVVCRENLR